MDLASRQVQILTDSSKDESPSFAPNGRMIVVATEIGGRGVLAAVSADGRIKQRLSVAAGDVREPRGAPSSNDRGHATSSPNAPSAREEHHAPIPRHTMLSLITAVVILVAGCSSTPAGPEQEGAAVESRTPEAISKSTDIPTVTAQPMQSKNLPPELSDPKNILSRRSIYFDYDKYDIKDEFKKPRRRARQVPRQPPRLQDVDPGQRDERGSREYNLALGQKRADAIKKALLLLGAREDQLESVSLGEEKPKAAGHDEAAWAENRRGDMLYGGEY